jgi:hypothetical protein
VNTTRPLSAGNNKCLFLVTSYDNLVQNMYLVLCPNNLGELLKKMKLSPYILAFII